MRILAISDEPSGRLWGDLCREALAGIDLILSAGDLPARYLSFLTCFTNAPVVYVHGNHDDRYLKEPPEGCLCADGKILLVNGVRILGLGGSIRYRPDGIHMYSEKEMASRIASLRGKLRSTGGFDILLTHAPIRGLGDQSWSTAMSTRLTWQAISGGSWNGTEFPSSTRVRPMSLTFRKPRTAGNRPVAACA